MQNHVRRFRGIQVIAENQGWRHNRHHFYCKTQLKERGYTERKEITGADGKDLFATKTDEELAAEIEELQRKLE